MGKLFIKGSFVALITPFNKAGKVDFDGFKTLIDFQATNGTSAVLIMGSTGEVSTLSIEEKQKIISSTMKFKNSELLQLYGCTGNTTQGTIEMVKYAASEGADGAIITVPSYIVPSVEAAVQYYIEVADASSIPIGIYNNPTRVGTDLTAEAIIKLASHPNIIIDKEAMGRPSQISKISAAKTDISLMCCDSPNLGLIIPVMALGGHGTANVTGNIAPQEMAMISKPWESFEDALNCRETYLKISPLLFFNYSKINPVPIKSLMKALGLPSGDLRKPNLNMDSQALGVGIKIVKELGLSEKYDFSIPDELIPKDEATTIQTESASSNGSIKCSV
ncbi:MAG: 4-hydroxy-tetrahydrodipicolinate synthase [Desulfobacterales bacterium]|jgi:4-hydroxy-tetrahydrodipicolinate synthase